MASLAKNIENQIDILKEELKGVSRKMELLMKKYERLEKFWMFSFDDNKLKFQFS